MVRKGKGKHRLDKFYHLAKEQGYRSRAAFKLIQLNRKFQFLNDCRAVLDLCAAPGGWLQVAAKHVPVSSLVVGIDLVPIKPVRGVKTLVADITTSKCRSLIKKEAAGSHFDVVLHDGAPNVGGAWHSEALSQTMLVLDSLKLASEFLAPKGWFITKVFRSNDYNALLYACKQLFERVDATKPSASRGTSAETFVVCQGYKAPAKIDPRLLDPKILFQEITDPLKSAGPLVLQKQTGRKPKRNRDGYADGASTTFKRSSALAFLQSEEAIEMLGPLTELVFDGPDGTLGAKDEGEGAESLAEKLKNDARTTAEIKMFCQDLQVLSRKDFKALLKWRLTMRKALEIGEKGEEEKEQRVEEDPETKILREMAEIKERMEHRQRKEKKRRRAQKRKSKIKLAKTVEGGGEMLDEGDGLFTLDSLKTAEDLARVSESQPLGREEMLKVQEDSDVDLGEPSDSEAEEDNRRYEILQEEYLETSYKRFLQEKGAAPEMTRSKRKRIGDKGELETGQAEDEEDALDYELIYGEGTPLGEEKAEGGGLLVELDESRIGVPKTPAAVSAQWFSQEVFNEPDLLEEEGGQNGGQASGKGGKKATVEKVEKHEDEDLESLESLQDSDEDSDDAAMATELKAIKETASGGEKQEGNGADSDDASDYGNLKKSIGEGAAPTEEGDFEEVAHRGGSSSGTDTEDEFRMLDVEGKAEVLALAKRFLRRKDKETIIDAAYNRYAFHDEGTLPKWFNDDEKEHMRPVRQVTRADIEEQKASLRALNSRPIKKVAEAKARKRQRLTQRLNSAKKRAEGIIAHEDTPMGSRMKEVAKIYAKARSEEKKWKPGKGKKSNRKVTKRKGPPLDARSRADRRMKGSGRDMKNAKRLASDIRQKASAKKQKREGKRAKRG
ncbi:hypothetical protein BSKO_03248 [Bryopsis sp. KO-2023]|nr:hypothetical protein BSKO_03248 [Bryopsis sp. KO-2023]